MQNAWESLSLQKIGGREDTILHHIKNKEKLDVYIGLLKVFQVVFYNAVTQQHRSGVNKKKIIDIDCDMRVRYYDSHKALTV